MLIAEMQIWENAPFRNLVPESIEIRRWSNNGNDIIVFWVPKQNIHHCFINHGQWNMRNKEDYEIACKNIAAIIDSLRMMEIMKYPKELNEIEIFDHPQCHQCDDGNFWCHNGDGKWQISSEYYETNGGEIFILEGSDEDKDNFKRLCEGRDKH